MISKELINHDTYRMELEYPNEEWISGGWPASHFKLYLNIGGVMKFKPFTPIDAVN